MHDRPALPIEQLDSDGVHIVLLGDSTLDNGRYLDLSVGELSVEKLMQRKCMERGWQMTVLAQDGSMLEDVRTRQLPLIPDRATHVIISATGNDLLSLLNEMVVANFSLSSMYTVIGTRLAELGEHYRDLVLQLKMLGFHVCVCTIQHPHFNHIFFKTIAIFGLGLHNSRIKQMAEELDCSVIDIANILDSPEDFANPLEMSTQGGSKLVGNIDQFVSDHPVSMLLRRAASYFDDDTILPDWMVVCQPKACCSARGHLRKVYAGKQIPTILDLVPLAQIATLESVQTPEKKNPRENNASTTTTSGRGPDQDTRAEQKMKNSSHSKWRKADKQRESTGESAAHEFNTPGNWEQDV